MGLTAKYNLPTHSPFFFLYPTDLFLYVTLYVCEPTFSSTAPFLSYTLQNPFLSANFAAPCTSFSVNPFFLVSKSHNVMQPVLPHWALSPGDTAGGHNYDIVNGAKWKVRGKGADFCLTQAKVDCALRKQMPCNKHLRCHKTLCYDQYRSGILSLGPPGDFGLQLP